jgi:hypothetical protein
MTPALTSRGANCTKFVAPLETQPTTTETFSNWWGAVIARDHHRLVFTRKKVVLTVANQVGGAHIDLEAPRRLRRYDTGATHSVKLAACT